MTDTSLSPLLAVSTSSTGFLVVESGSLSGQRFALPPAPGALLLGRERICNIRFDPERDRVVGRTHARLEVRADGVYLVDLNSANGTFRSDGSAVRGEVRLGASERFQLGGEGGPWLSLQLTAAPANVAVHVALPAAEAATLIMPAAALPVAPVKPPPEPQPKVPARTEPPPPSVTPPLVRTAPESPLHSEQRPAPRVESAPVDPQALHQRRQYQRQIAVISLLLLLACSVGLALGLRESAGDRADEVSQGE